MDNREKITTLKSMGLTYAQIGFRLGVSRQRAEQMYHREEYNARQRHYNHRFTASPQKYRRKPCHYCESKS
jgi:hypothetical protein